jgi:hypothetical protein
VHPSNRASQLSLHPRCAAAAGHYECLGSVGTTQLQVSLKDQDTRQFTYDQVLEESTTQEKVFEGGHMMRCLPGSPGAGVAAAPAALAELADLSAAQVPEGHLQTQLFCQAQPPSHRLILHTATINPGLNAGTVAGCSMPQLQAAACSHMCGLLVQWWARRW